MTGIVKKAVRAAMEQRGGHVQIIAPDKINGKTPKVVEVRDHIIRIQECDPLSFLMEAMRTGQVPYHNIDQDGNVDTQYAMVKPGERISIAKFLTDKLVPASQVMEVIHRETSPVDDNRSSFQKLVDEAINRGRPAPEGPKVLGSKSH